MIFNNVVLSSGAVLIGVQLVALWFCTDWALSLLIVLEWVGVSWLMVALGAGLGSIGGVILLVGLTCGVSFGLSALVRTISGSVEGGVTGTALV